MYQLYDGYREGMDVSIRDLLILMEHYMLFIFELYNSLNILKYTIENGLKIGRIKYFICILT
jgi:hypothetical protein